MCFRKETTGGKKWKHCYETFILEILGALSLVKINVKFCLQTYP